MTLDLNLPPDLFLDLVLDQFFLVQALEGDNVMRFGLGPRHVDAAKLALAERATDLERRERERDSGSVAVSERSGGSEKRRAGPMMQCEGEIMVSFGRPDAQKK